MLVVYAASHGAGAWRRAFVRFLPASYRLSRGREGFCGVEVPCWTEGDEAWGQAMSGNRERRQDGLLPSKPALVKKRGTSSCSEEEVHSLKRQEADAYCSRGSVAGESLDLLARTPLLPVRGPCFPCP